MVAGGAGGAVAAGVHIVSFLELSFRFCNKLKTRYDDCYNYNMGSAVNHVRFLYICRALGHFQLAEHLVNEVNQGPCYVKSLFTKTF